MSRFVGSINLVPGRIVDEAARAGDQRKVLDPRFVALVRFLVVNVHASCSTHVALTPVRDRPDAHI